MKVKVGFLSDLPWVREYRRRRERRAYDRLVLKELQDVQEKE